METAETPATSDELKLTSNLFSISQGPKFRVTMESVLIGGKLIISILYIILTNNYYYKGILKIIAFVLFI